jgi:hypothetical protein
LTSRKAGGADASTTLPAPCTISVSMGGTAGHALGLPGGRSLGGGARPPAGRITAQPEKSRTLLRDRFFDTV